MDTVLSTIRKRPRGLAPTARVAFEHISQYAIRMTD